VAALKLQVYTVRKPNYTALHGSALLFSTFACPKDAQLHIGHSKEAPFSFEAGSIRTASQQRTPDHRTSMIHASSL
jgi:hypothetical protein